MSSGERFLKKRVVDPQVKSHVYDEITMDRMHIVNAVAPYLQSLNIISDAKDITNIQFSDVFGRSDKEFVTLKIFTKGSEASNDGGAPN